MGEHYHDGVSGSAGRLQEKAHDPLPLASPPVPLYPSRMLKRLYDWMMGMAGDGRAPWALAFVSFIESSVFPIPPDVMLIPMVLSRRDKAWHYATLATIASVLGGILGYAIGYYLYDAVGLPILKFYGREGTLDGFIQFVHDWGVPAIIIKGMTPIPFKVVTIAAGVAKMNLPAFIGASIIARALRFYLVAGLLYWFGEPIRAFIEKRLALVTTIFVISLVAGFVLLKFLF